MSDRSTIEWCDASWNPVRGCERVSPGCSNCYAERVAARFRGPGGAFEGLVRVRRGGPRWTGKIRLVEEHLEDPLHWRKPRRVFVASVADVFHRAVPQAYLDRIWAVMARAPQHTFQVLTKRPDEAAAYLRDPATRDRVGELVGSTVPWPLPNVWLGTSIEDQVRIGRAGSLMQAPAALRFLSLEPLLGAVRVPGLTSSPVGGPPDWIIVGGESGPGARECNLAWVRSLVEQARARGVPCFVKQLGARPVLPHGTPLELADPKGGDPAEWPEDLRVREWPA